jgi:hypothetical protein
MRHDPKEFLQRGCAAIFPSGEKTRDVMAGRIGHGDRPQWFRSAFYSEGHLGMNDLRACLGR